MYIPDEDVVSNSTEVEYGHTMMDAMCICIWTVTSLLILIFNSTCLVLLHKVKGFSKATVVFMKSLTIADLILGVFFYLPPIGVFISGRQWPYGDAACFIQAWLIRVVLPMTAISVLLVTIDRYTAIVHPMKYEMWLSLKRARILTCSLWLLSLLYGLMTSFLNNWQAMFSEFYLICTIGKFGENNSVVALMVISITVFLVIMAMYIRILVIAQRHAAQIAHHRPSVTSMVSANEPPPPSPNRKSFTTVFIITMTLLIGWMPSVILGLTSYAKEPLILLVIFTQIPLASVSWLNVVVYYIRNQAFRETALELHLQFVRYCKGCCQK